MGESAPLITLCGVVLGPLTAAGMLYYVVVVGQGIGAGAQRPLVFFCPGVSLHVATRIEAEDRAGLERLCR